MTRMVHCVKLNTEAPGLSAPPYPGELGEKIFQQVSQQAWQMWLQHQTMLINEYRLDVLEDEARGFLEQEMDNFLFGDGSAAPAGYVAPTDKK